MQILVLIGTVGASLHIGEILPNTLWLFWLSCPVFFSRERGQVEPLNRFSRFMAQTTCFRVRKCLLGVRMIGDVIWGKYTPTPLPPKWAWIGNFKPKRQNIKITVSPNLWIRSRPNLRTNLRSTIALHRWSNVIQIKSNMAAGRHLEKIDMMSLLRQGLFEFDEIW